MRSCWVDFADIRGSMLSKLEHFQVFPKGFGDQDRELAVQGVNSPAVRALDNDYVKVAPFPYQSFLKDIF